MKLFHLKEHQYLIQLQRQYSWTKFRKTVKVTPGTYSETYAKDIFSSVFEHSTNLEKEYHAYYQGEYDTIDQFLFWRYGISENIQEELGTIRNGYLAIFDYPWYINEDEILKESMRQLFHELDQ